MKIGIDFGSTYSTFSVYNTKTDHLEVKGPKEGSPHSLPSAVAIDDSDGVALFAEKAKNVIGREEYRYFDAFKMLLIENNEEVLRKRGYDSEYSPRLIAAKYFQSILGSIAKRLDDTIEEVVICVPEIWEKKANQIDDYHNGMISPDGRILLRDILRDEVPATKGSKIRVVTEPEAASAYFAFNYEKVTGKRFSGHLLLIDYGGGTLDLTITRVTSQKGSMDISRCESGGAGENHPDEAGRMTIGDAGIAYMQSVVLTALTRKGLLKNNDDFDPSKPVVASMIQTFENILTDSDRIDCIEDTFGSYGKYSAMGDILSDPPMKFCTLRYNGTPVEVTYQDLYTAYHMTIEPVLNRELTNINLKMKEIIHADPTSPKAGGADNFKIALVGGFSNFFLVREQIAEIYNFSSEESQDLRVKNMDSDNKELAISFGAALMASGRVNKQTVARFSLGLYLQSQEGRPKPRYCIHDKQIIEPGKIYYLLERGKEEDKAENRLHLMPGIISRFVIHQSGKTYPNRPKRKYLDAMRNIPGTGLWFFGISMDENELLSIHMTPAENTHGEVPLTLPLDTFKELFDSSAIEEFIEDVE